MVSDNFWFKGEHYTYRVSSRIWGGGGPASVPLCSHPRYTRWAGGGGGGYASTDLIGPVGCARLSVCRRVQRSRYLN